MSAIKDTPLRTRSTFEKSKESKEWVIVEAEDEDESKTAEDLIDSINDEDDDNFLLGPMEDISEISASVCDLVGNPAFCEMTDVLRRGHPHVENEKKTQAEFDAMPTREYLNLVLVPILMKALSHVTTLRPPSAIKAVATYLLKNKSKYEIKTGTKSSSTVNRSDSDLSSCSVNAEATSRDPPL